MRAALHSAMVGAIAITVLAAFHASAAPASHPADSPASAGAVADKAHLGSFAWTDARWRDRCRGVRTSYNPRGDLSDERLTLRPGDPRWLDFVFWTLSNKVNEHQLEAYGGTGWAGPKGGVTFHWAPGSHWERDTLHGFGFAIGHVVGEHRWTDTMFPDFFERYGGVYGINLKDRLAEIDPRSPAPWIAFLQYAGGAGSPYYRYLMHMNASVDAARRKVVLFAGQGITFEYSFGRYQHELAMILTDCRAVDFFQMYDRFGPGFAAEGNWARQPMPQAAAEHVGFASHVRYAPDLGSGGGTGWSPAPRAAKSPEVPSDLPEAERMRRGERVYRRECIDCHGAGGDGEGFLADGLDVKPRDFRQGIYKFRTTLDGELPTIADVERTTRRGVPGSTMPAWGQFLGDQEIGDVARYLVTFSPRFTAQWRRQAKPRELPISAVPLEVRMVASHPTGDPRPCVHEAPGAHSLACSGEKLWNVFQCRLCHGDEGRGDGPNASSLVDAWDHPVRPADLTYKWLFKNGDQPENVYRSIFDGLNGTPMSSYARFVPDERDRWALVAFVLSLSPPTRAVLHLADFAGRRWQAIGPDGRVLPGSPPLGRVP